MLQNESKKELDVLASAGGMRSYAGGVSFPSTAWTMIEQAKQGHGQSQEEFFRRYATPVFCYIHALGADRSTAQDITQEIFVKLVTGKLLEHFEPRRHRFRYYLARVVKNQWYSIWREMKAAKRAPAQGIKRLDEILAQAGSYLEPSTYDKPEDAFWRQLAHEILNATIHTVRDQCEQADLSEHFAVFARRFLQQPEATWDEIGHHHRISGQKAANMAQTVLRRFRKTLMEQLRCECETEAEIMEEIRRFIGFFSGEAIEDPPSREPDL